MNKSTLYFIANSLTLLCSSLLNYKSGADMTIMVISVLGSFCVFLFQHLVMILLKNKKAVSVILACTMLFYVFYSPAKLFPLIIILTFEFIDVYVSDEHLYQITGVIFVIMIFLFSPPIPVISLSVISMGLTIYAGYVIDKLNIYKEICENQKEELSKQNKKLTDIKSFASAIKTQTALEERNRFAGRIHDQLGHGISGSIIMLEAALMMLRINPEKAEESIRKSVNCLRNGVDDIRMSLREERPHKLFLGIGQITSMLKEFELTYSIRTEFTNKGNMERVPGEVWQCIIENLEESLTNMLKHSNGDMFSVNIEIYNKILKAEFSDNGKCTGEYEKGIGLDAIEERTVKCGGRCLVSCGQNGFSTIFLFNIM